MFSTVDTIALMEIVSAVYVFLSLLGQFLEHAQTKSARQIRVCSILTLSWIMSDALTYLFNGPGANKVIMDIMCLLSYTLVNLVLIEYLRYCDTYFNEKTTLSPWVFRTPTIVLMLNTILVAVIFFQGKLIVSVDGVYQVVGTVPIYVFVIYISMLLYSPIVAWFKRKEIGIRLIVIFATFGLPVIIAILIVLLFDFDCTVVMGGISAIFLVTFLQNESTKTRLQNARETAEAANKAKTDFLFSMSHDIRTPMNAILGYADIALRHGDDTARVKDSINKIKLSGGHLLNLINDILEMSRIESGKLEIAENPVDIREVISGVSQMSEALAVSKDVNFVTTVGEINAPYVMSDELHVNEILINLISNAVKYNHSGGRVEFCTEQIENDNPGYVGFRFTVKDNGIGMSEEFQKHLFEDFARENTTTVSKQEGAGLGLSIVKRIVDLAGGIIRMESKKNEGSTFVVELPMRVMDEEMVTRFKADKEKEWEIFSDDYFIGKKVLLVEDNDLNREIATEILEDAGFEVESAEDGDIAVKKVTSQGVNYYDFILMDIQMPVMDGYEATIAIRGLKDGDKIPIIALSANAFVEDIDKSLAVGMNAHVAKPINIKLLLDTMRNVM